MLNLYDRLGLGGTNFYVLRTEPIVHTFEVNFDKLVEETKLTLKGQQFRAEFAEPIMKFKVSFYPKLTVTQISQNQKEGE
jgi:hypothetical protein